MPGMNGFEVCQRLRQDSSTAQVPVIFLTAKTSSEDIVQGFEAGAVDYVTKPFNAPELLARVKNHLRLQSAEAELRAQNLELVRINEVLQQTMHQLKTLEGLLPICMYCKKIRQQGEDPKIQDSWLAVETYIEQHSAAVFSHGCCPSCMEAHFPKVRLRR